MSLPVIISRSEKMAQILSTWKLHRLRSSEHWRQLCGLYVSTTNFKLWFTQHLPWKMNCICNNISKNNEIGIKCCQKYIHMSQFLHLKYEFLLDGFHPHPPLKMIVSNKGWHTTTVLYSTGLHPHVQPDFLCFLLDHGVGLISRCQFNLITNSSSSRPPSESCREALQVWCRVCVHISSFILAQLQWSRPANFLALWLSLI